MEDNYDELISEIEELKKENQQLKEWQGQVTKLLNQMLDAINSENESVNKLKQYSYINRIRIESLPYELRDKGYVSPVFVPQIMSKHETRRAIIDKKMSISRFGDGEFAIIAGIGRWNFQAASDKLAEKLIKVIKSNEDDLLLGLPKRFYGNLEAYSEADADAVRHYMRPEVRKQHAQIIDAEKIYGNALMHEIFTEQDKNELKEIWDKRECVFIEGRHTGMGVGNDLFDNAASIERIIAPAENAVERYDDIMDAAIKNSKDKIFLIALGPTATALAYDLYKEGYQAIDIGHADLYYEKYIRQLKDIQDVSIPYKYCSWDEIGERRQIEDITDPQYNNQIIAKIF